MVEGRRRWATRRRRRRRRRREEEEEEEVGDKEEEVGDKEEEVEADWTTLLRDSKRNPWHILYTPSYDDLEVVIQSREGNKLQCFIMLCIDKAKLCHPNNPDKFVPFPGHLFKGRAHISLTSVQDGWEFKNYEEKHHYDMRCESLLSTLKCPDIWGELRLSADNAVLTVGEGSKLFALVTMLQEQLGGGQKYRRLHVSLKTPLSD